MIATSLKMNEKMEELLPRENSFFPFTAFYESYSIYTGGSVPWHWHPDVEFMLLLQGSVKLYTNNHTYLLGPGEAAFINSNILHYKEAIEGPVPVSLNQIFDAGLISGGYKSIFEQKYVSPILQCKSLEAMAFYPALPRHQKILELLKHSYDLAEEGGYGYELAVRSDLSLVWRLLCEEAAPVLSEPRITSGRREERIKKMLLFIQEHFHDKISLAQIAESANISERECLRCFKQTLNTTPFTYLLEYRIRMAARMLSETDMPVTEIALACGFTGVSYLGKHFKMIMGCTPSEYRAGPE